MSFKLDEVKYKKRILDLSQSGIVDFYSRYDLPPGCDDDVLVQAAVATVPKTWSKLRHNPRYTKVITLFMTQHTEAAGVLTDPVKRKAYFEQNQAKIKSAVEEVTKKFAASVNILRAQGVATREQVEQIYVEFQGSVEKQKIDSAVAGIPVIDVKEPPQMDKTVYGDIKGYLNTVDANDLYHFLGLTRFEATPEKIARSNQVKQNEADQRRQDAITNAMQKLCSSVKVHLLDPGKKALYDNALDMEKSGVLEEEVQRASKLGGIPVKASSHLLTRGQELGLSAEAARAVIIRTAARLGVRVAFRGDQFPSCVGCGLEIKGDPDKCPTCDTPLRVQCPKCAAVCRTYDSACKCGLAVDDMQRIRGVEETWKLYLGLDLFSEVKSDLAWAAGKIGRTGWVAGVCSVEFGRALIGSLHAAVLARGG